MLSPSRRTVLVGGNKLLATTLARAYAELEISLQKASEGIDLSFRLRLCLRICLRFC